MDFRGKSERQAETAKAWAEEMDYKREFERVRDENAKLHGKLDKITENHGELQAQFNDLLTRFRAVKAENEGYAADLLKIAKNIETMVGDAYQKQGDLMNRFRADLSKRLSDAKATVGIQGLLDHEGDD